MMRLIQTSVVPPGGYSYTQPETGQVLQSDSLHQLVNRVVAHRKANNLPVPFNIEDIVEEALCKERGELCADDSPAPVKRTRPVALDLAVRLTRTLVAAGGKRVESQAEADQRAAICSTCYDNVEPKGCSGCKSGLVRKAVEFIVGARKTAYDNLLKSCQHCGCFNAAQVWLPLDALQKTMSDAENEALPDHCWKRK